MAGLKKGDRVQVLDREDGMYWEAVVRDINMARNEVTVWIPLCKLKITYNRKYIRERVEERPLQRHTTFKRADLRLLVRKRRVVYLDRGKKMVDEVKVNDPFLASIEFKSGKRLAYERVVEIRSMSEDEDEDEHDEKNVAKRTRRNTVHTPPKKPVSKHRHERLQNRARIRNESSTSRRLKSASLTLVKRARNFRPDQFSRLAATSSKSDVNVNFKRHVTQQNNKPKMVDAEVSTVESDAVETSDVALEIREVNKNASSMTEPSALVSEFDNSTPTELDHEDETVPEPAVPNYHVPYFDSGISKHQMPSDLSNGNTAMANLDFGTSSISVYNSSNMCNMYPSALPLHQRPPSKAQPSYTPSLSYLPTYNGNASTLPYMGQNSYQPLQNNNVGDVGSNSQLARLSDLIEKAFYESKEQSVLLRRILEGQEAMIGHLATIVQGISQSTVESDVPQSFQTKETMISNFPNGISNVYINGSNDDVMENDAYRTPMNECNGMDLSMHKNHT